MKRYQMTVTALSPIHIGTGEDLPPFEYVVRDNVFYRIDLTSMLQELTPPQREDFNRAVDADNLVYVRKFIAKNVDLDRYTLYKAPISEDLAEAYAANLDNPNNQLLIQPTMRRPDTWQPIIPGSSLKGAIRTAVVSCLMADSPPDKPLDWKSFESDILKYRNERGRPDMGADPFRCLRIADVSLPLRASLVDRTVIFKPEVGDLPDPQGIQRFHEMTFCRLDGEDVAGQTEITIDDRLPGTKVRIGKDRDKPPRKAMNMGLDAETICDCCRRFYAPKIEEEHNKFYVASEELQEANAPLLRVSYGEREFPIRVGHFSHVECVTVDGHRSPITPRKDKKTGEYLWGTTRTLAGGTYPMGWAKIALKEIQ